MKKMRITALILAACMLLALLAGCSKQENVRFSRKLRSLSFPIVLLRTVRGDAAGIVRLQPLRRRSSCFGYRSLRIVSPTASTPRIGRVGVTVNR